MARRERVKASSARSQKPLLERTAYRLGGATRSLFNLVTWPFRWMKPSKRRRVRRSRRRRRDRGRDRLVAARMAADQGLGALAKALSHPDPHVRTKALEVIAELSEERASGLIAGMLHDPSSQTRRAAAAAARRIGAQGAVFSLILALDDPDLNVRMVAKESIEELTNHPIDITFEESEGERLQRIAELKEWWKGERLDQLATGDAPL